MATLEIHDGQGRVQFVELERDHMVLFGTSPACEIILEGPEIKPVHGRIRWKADRVRLESSPDAQFLTINGRKMVSGSAGQGDEITVGPCRIFVLRLEGAPEPATRTTPKADEGRTRVMAPPVPESLRAARREEERRAAPRPLPRMGSRTPVKPPVELWGELLGLESSLSVEIPLTKDAKGKKPSAEPGGWLPQIIKKWIPASEVAPGREQIASSPLVLGLIAAFVILVGMGFWLKSIIASTLADRVFNRGLQNFEDGDYRTAIRDFDAFLAGHPKDARVGKARVIKALANVRQYISPNGSTWSSALEAAREMLDQTAKYKEFVDERPELGEVVIRIGEGLADRARHGADSQALAEAESAVQLHTRVAGEHAAAFLGRSRLPSKLAEARAAVRKAQVRAQALTAMDQAIKEGSAAHVYQARDDLVVQYADLAHDRELVARMTAANELIRKAVTIDTTRRPAARTVRPDPLGPATGVVLRTRRDESTGTPSPESIVFALADGFAYGLDASKGAPLWQVPVGLASPFVPQPVSGEAAAIVFDARSDELIRLDSRTGTLAWRLDLRERVADPPLVVGNQLAQVLPSGNLVMIALDSGEIQATVKLGRPLARMPVHDESGRHLYVVSRQDCLFILTRDPLACTAVEYLGHLDGSIPCAPARLGRFLVIPQNDTLNDSIWQVLVLDTDGGKVQPVQELKVAGWTWQTPAESGQIVWATGDKAGFEAFAVGDYGSKTPFRSVARLTAEVVASGPAYALARSEREMWAASGHPGKYVLDPEHGSIEPAAPLPVPGPALAPIQLAARIIVATFQDRLSGGVCLWGIDSDTAAIVWKTVVGAPWPSPLARSADSKGLTTLGRDGREVVISPEQMTRGGFIVLPVPRSGEFTLPRGLRLHIERDGKSVLVIAPQPYSNALWVQDSSTPGGWRELRLPAVLSTDPLVWGDAVLVPGADGRVYLIDPFTGLSRAEPFVPQFDRDRQGTWRTPALLDRDTVALADDVGRVRRLGLKTSPVPRLIAEAETTLDSPIVSDPASTGGAVVLATADRRIRSLAARDLSPVGGWKLDAPIASGPISLGDGGLAIDRAGGVMAFGRDGQRIWSIKLGAEVVGPPQVIGRSLAFLTADGLLHLRARSDGAPIDRRALGVLPAGGLLATGREAMIAVAPGTIRPLALETLGASNP
jgi:outer membrane protein assembly factor BamB